MKKVFSIILSSLAMVSCVDTVLLPDDKTVEEDFWQTKSDVEQMVNGAYAAFINNESVQRSLIVWTSRADELVVNSTLSNNDLNQIGSANIQTTNSYCDWSGLYTVINDCNLVIDKSASVREIDPNYLEGDHNNYVGQMKALRALCYFYLVRTFRDVPMILEPYKESSQEMNVPQTAPSIVIDQIISDLEEVKNYTLSSQSASSDGERVAYFTRDGVYALLADVYLWKASIYADEASYDKCIEYCNVIRNNRKAVTPGHDDGIDSQFDDDGNRLTNYSRYFEKLFTGNGNSSESLLEMAYTDNPGLARMYNKINNNSSSSPYFYASKVYSVTSGSNDGTCVYYGSNISKDVRGCEFVYQFGTSSDAGNKVRKMVALSSRVSGSSVSADASVGSRSFNSYDQNWIVYRITDVMLMKAEAMVQKALLRRDANASLVERIASATNKEDSLSLANELLEVNKTISHLNVTAARQAQIVNMRAHTDQSTEIDSTTYRITETAYDNGDLAAFVRRQVNTFDGFAATGRNLEVVVMDERARELCFEGKRWYDMLRYNYRHTTGVNYSTILANQGGGYAANYSEMLSLISRKYDSGGSAVTAKMQTEPYLYMPLYKSEVEDNPSLRQNPVYNDGATSEKNY